MKYTCCIRRPKQGEDLNEVVNKWNRILLKGGTVHWRKGCDFKAFVEPIHEDGTPAVELGYIYMLVEGPLIGYLKDKIEYGIKCAIHRGWPEEGTVKRYLGA